MVASGTVAAASLPVAEAGGRASVAGGEKHPVRSSPGCGGTVPGGNRITQVVQAVRPSHP